jgi:hypothetical protein
VDNNGKPDTECLEKAEAVQSGFGVVIEDYFDEYWTVETLGALYDALDQLKSAIGQKAYGYFFPTGKVTIKIGGYGSSHWSDNSVWLAHSLFHNYDRGTFKIEVVHELHHGILHRMEEDEAEARFAKATGWKENTHDEMKGVLWFFCHPEPVTEWGNPNTGPTDYARTADRPKEDASDTFAALVVGAPTQYPITWQRVDWFHEWIQELQQRGNK